MLPSEAKTKAKRDSVLEAIQNSPKSPDREYLLTAPGPELPRAVTPELIPDRMGSRLPDQPDTGLDGLVPEDVPVQSMHERISPFGNTGKITSF